MLRKHDMVPSLGWGSEEHQSWKFIGSTTNDSFILNGVDIFKEKWVATGIFANVIDPIYGVKKNFIVWKIEDYEVTFAAGEFSNNVWGIYTNN